LAAGQLHSVEYAGSDDPPAAASSGGIQSIVIET